MAAAAVNGTRQLSVVTPAGIAYIPRPREDAVVMSDGNEQLCLGVRMMANDRGIKPGEIMVFSSNDTYIHLTNDGKIYISGEVYINGERLEVE